ncbi:MAG TPA: transcriptional regulator, BadM/Rrf2 family protein [Verrucomicrobiales bacterium]|nr:transcriptional regulator, BadM/Rrf2 family protein [Verrucomicrobiales bacterium]HBU58636.1 transcriptional regulator, BadM/Rrf2 family protein [Verrucomicrobiales bacterium]
MRLSVKTDYAARAVLELAKQPVNGQACKVEELALASGTSANFLVQILIDLKSAQIVASARGKQGGYRLAKIPEEITLGDVWRAVDGQVLDTPALEDENCPGALQDAWGQIRDSVNRESDEINFSQLLEATGREKEMYYI